MTTAINWTPAMRANTSRRVDELLAELHKERDIADAFRAAADEHDRIADQAARTAERLVGLLEQSPDPLDDNWEAAAIRDMSGSR